MSLYETHSCHGQRGGASPCVRRQGLSVTLPCRIDTPQPIDKICYITSATTTAAPNLVQISPQWAFVQLGKI